VLFTSGTTSLPKGCPQTNIILNAFMKNLALSASSSDDIFCSVLPNNHAMGYLYSLYFFLHGGAVLYPSASFDAGSMACALRDHFCTHTCLVPTMLHSLVDYIERYQHHKDWPYARPLRPLRGSSLYIPILAKHSTIPTKRRWHLTRRYRWV
jgi:acyl-CoA synthetase (AMP-forming)/AMP-acid ligase II